MNGRIFLFLLLVMFENSTTAQRMSHGASRSMSRPSAGNRSINGGSYRSPSASTRPAPSTRQNIPDTRNKSRNQNANINSRDVNNRDINNRNVNNINNSNNRNTVVRQNNIAVYPRPPYAWGGRRFYSFHPYAYHPFTPYHWGPSWNPWGFFVAALAITAIVVAMDDDEYHYDEGVWYTKSQDGYTVVQAPVGGNVNNIPSGAETVVVNNTTNYYYGGAYYEKKDSGYQVVAPQAGAVVEKLPAGGEEVKIGDQTYVKVGETYYQPIQVDGKNKYEVAQVEQEE
jgi:hypothetical protein